MALQARERDLAALQLEACGQTDAARAALSDSQRRVALLEAMVDTLRQRLTEEEEANAALASQVRGGAGGTVGGGGGGR